jgi:hypothetical protein
VAGLPGEETLFVPMNHHTICQFSDPDDEVFLKLTNYLNKWIGSSPKIPSGTFTGGSSAGYAGVDDRGGSPLKISAIVRP